MPSEFIWLAAALSLAYYAPSARALLSRRAGGAEEHWQSKAMMYGVYSLFFALSALEFTGPSGWANPAGILPAIAGVWLHYRAVKALGGAYSAGTKFGNKARLVTTGVYSAARHPLYSAAALFFLGLAFVLFSEASAVAYGLVLAYLAYRVTVEEAVLRRKFGRDYGRYAARVPATVFGWLLRK